MNYRHIFHAGSFSDVFKHVVLIALLETLKRKDTPFCYLDTHSGRGLYDLTSIEAQKTHEYETGILALYEYINSLSSTDNIPSLIRTYLSIVKDFEYPHYYPGSPLIAQAFVRECDHLVLLELHPEEVQGLKKCFKKVNKVAIHHQDGYLGLKAFLPPKERRGLVLIDPPFEKENEWDCIIDSLKIAMQKFETGIYAVWYPIKDKKTVDSFLNSINILFSKVLVTEFNIYPDDSAVGLIGCGMVIINPPWQLEETLEEMISWLKPVLSQRIKQT